MAALEARYGGRMNPYRMLMAQVPEGAALIPNPLSGAPGFFVGRMAAFPGIPRLLREMFAWIRPHVAGTRKSRVTLLSQAPESEYAGIMGEMQAAYPDVSIGSYPTVDAEYRVRIVFRADDPARAAACANAFTARLRDAGMDVARRIEEGGETG